LQTAPCPHCGEPIDKGTWVSRGAALSAASNGNAGRKKIEACCRFCGLVIDGKRLLRVHEHNCPVAEKCPRCRRKFSASELRDHVCTRVRHA
jgi:hypothetical protein